MASERVWPIGLDPALVDRAVIGTDPQRGESGFESPGKLVGADHRGAPEMSIQETT